MKFGYILALISVIQALEIYGNFSNINFFNLTESNCTIINGKKNCTNSTLMEYSSFYGVYEPLLLTFAGELTVYLSTTTTRTIPLTPCLWFSSSIRPSRAQSASITGPWPLISLKSKQDHMQRPTCISVEEAPTPSMEQQMLEESAIFLLSPGDM